MLLSPTNRVVLRFFATYLFIYFEKYLVRGAQFSGVGLNGVLMKRKNNTKDNNSKRNERTKYKWYW